MFRSLHEKLLKLPNPVEVYPAHGAGSLCGKQMSTDRSSTIGRERDQNYALRPTLEADFVGLVTSDLPERPEYFAQDKERNRNGAPIVAKLTNVMPCCRAELQAPRTLRCQRPLRRKPLVQVKAHRPRR